MSDEWGRSDEELASLPISLRDDYYRDQVVVVSGAGSGIGKAIAFWFARLGAQLAICGRNLERLEATAAALRKLGADVLVQQMTIRDTAQVNAFIDAVWERFGHIDILVNNAGGQFPQAAIDFAPKGWNAVIDTNLNGPWYMMQAAARRWRDAGRAGSIVNIVAAFGRGMPGIAHTCAARAGVVYLSKTLAIEWAPLNIRVNCVAPGAIEIERTKAEAGDYAGTWAKLTPLGRIGLPLDVARVVTFLASEAAAFVTGQTIWVDGALFSRPAWPYE